MPRQGGSITYHHREAYVELPMLPRGDLVRSTNEGFPGETKYRRGESMPEYIETRVESALIAILV